MAGPATNITSLTVLLGVLGKRATLIYLAAIALFSVLAGLALDQVYALLGISPQAVVGQAAELAPAWARWGGALLIMGLSVRPVWRSLKARWQRIRGVAGGHDHTEPASGCAGST